MTTETRFIQPFHSVRISDNISTCFYFSENDTFKIVLQGGEKLLPKVCTNVIDSVLHISNGNKWNWIRDYSKSDITMAVYTNSVRNMTYDGYKEVEFVDTLNVPVFGFESMGGMGPVNLKIRCDSVSLQIHKGSPDITISGLSEHLYLYSHAHGKIDALNFHCEHVVVHSAGTAESYVSPSASIGATIDYIGNIYYRNNPQIIWLVENNSGKLIKID